MLKKYMDHKEMEKEKQENEKKDNGGGNRHYNKVRPMKFV